MGAGSDQRAPERFPILKAVAAPPKLVGAEPRLAQVGAGIAAGTYVFSGFDGFWFIVGVAICHAIALFLTYRDPDTSRIWAARLQAGRARSLRRIKGNHYVA